MKMYTVVYFFRTQCSQILRAYTYPSLIFVDCLVEPEIAQLGLQHLHAFKHSPVLYGIYSQPTDIRNSL